MFSPQLNDIYLHDVNYVIEIDEVTLGLITIPIKDVRDEFYLIPAWNVYGTLVEEQKDGTREAVVHLQDFEIPLLTINAIDGSLL